MNIEMKISRNELYATVFSQQFSPCGNYLVSGNNFGKISVFNVTQALTIDATVDCKLPLHTFQAHKSYVYCLTSNERFLISGGSNKIHCWLWKDVIHQKEPKPVWSVYPPSSCPFELPETNGIAVNQKDNTLIAGCGDNNVYIWDLETGELKQTLKGHTDYVQCVLYLQNSQKITSAGEDGVVRFWDQRSGEETERIEPNKLEMAKRLSLGNWISCITADKNEDWFICGGAAHLTVWHLRSKTATAVLPTPNSCPQVVTFEDDFILSAGTEPSVFKWSINGELRTKFPCSPNSVFSLEINETANKLLAIGGNSYKMDISTNFQYKAFSLTVKDR